MSDRIIGVDVGGTKIAVATLTGEELSEPDVEPTDTSGTEALLDQLERMIGRQGDAQAVGIAVPSVVDFATGTARFSVNIPLAGVPLRDDCTYRRTIAIPGDRTRVSLTARFLGNKVVAPETSATRTARAG